MNTNIVYFFEKLYPAVLEAQRTIAISHFSFVLIPLLIGGCFIVGALKTAKREDSISLGLTSCVFFAFSFCSLLFWLGLHLQQVFSPQYTALKETIRILKIND